MLSSQITLPLGTLHVATQSDAIAPQLRLEKAESGVFLIHLRLENGGEEFVIPPFRWSLETPVSICTAFGT